MYELTRPTKFTLANAVVVKIQRSARKARVADHSWPVRSEPERTPASEEHEHTVGTTQGCPRRPLMASARRPPPPRRQQRQRRTANPPARRPPLQLLLGQGGPRRRRNAARARRGERVSGTKDKRASLGRVRTGAARSRAIAIGQFDSRTLIHPPAWRVLSRLSASSSLQATLPCATASLSPWSVSRI